MLLETLLVPQPAAQEVYAPQVTLPERFPVDKEDEEQRCSRRTVLFGFRDTVGQEAIGQSQVAQEHGGLSAISTS